MRTLKARSRRRSTKRETISGRFLSWYANTSKERGSPFKRAAPAFAHRLLAKTHWQKGRRSVQHLLTPFLTTRELVYHISGTFRSGAFPKLSVSMKHTAPWPKSQFFSSPPTVIYLKSVLRAASSAHGNIANDTWTRVQAFCSIDAFLGTGRGKGSRSLSEVTSFRVIKFI